MAVTREAIKNYFPDGGLERRLQPLPRYGCIYVRNAKVATGSILVWLHRLHTGDYAFTPTRHIYRENELPRVWDVGWEEVLRMLNGEAFRFSFVRDPIQRVESAYMSKVLKHRRYPGRAALPAPRPRRPGSARSSCSRCRGPWWTRRLRPRVR